MKVLHIIDKLNVGGAEKVFIDITHLLATKNVAVDALLFDDTGALTPLLDKRLKVYSLNRVDKYSLRKMYELHRICRQYNIVHVHMRHCYQYVRLVQLLFGGGYKLVIHDHYGIDKTIPASLRSVFKPRYYIGVCRSLTDWAREEVKIAAERVFLLRNIVIPSAVSFTPKPGEANAMMVANISRVKNIEFAISLFQQMKQPLTIYGNDRDTVYYNSLKEQIGDNGQIQIVGNVTDFANVYDRYGLAIHTSRSESGPLVLLEYMAAGIPFIAYNTGEVAEVAAKELPLLFMDNFDTDKWIQRIKEITAMTGLSGKMKAVFEKHFSPQKYVDECLEIYGRISC